MSLQPVLINGEWTVPEGTGRFRAVNPVTREPLDDEHPVSPWSEVERAIVAASAAFEEIRSWPGERFADFLDTYADLIEARRNELVEVAHMETALATSPRLADVELPRTSNQLRQAAAAAREGSWAQPTIDTATNIRSAYGPIGPVAVFGPNNFPYAFNGIAGGDFAAAVAAGNPVIAKGHPSHPRTTQLLAEQAVEAARATQMPRAMVQLIYRISHEDGRRFVSHRLLGATGYTGSRHAGLALKQAADEAGKPIYLELSSINPVFVLPGALEERLEAIAEDFTGSCLMGTGQFCTNPGLVIVKDDKIGRQFLSEVAVRFEQAAVGTMLSEGVLKSFDAGIKTLTGAGARIVAGGNSGGGRGFCFQNTLLEIDGNSFLADPERLQSEAFGNGSLVVMARDEDQMLEVAGALEGNLTGCIYSHTGERDDERYDRLAPVLRGRVGRLLNDKMPTGVAVSAAMNHGGPFPATGHPAFTAVGIPASLTRFGMLQCYDQVRPHRLPPALQDKNPNGKMWRVVDGNWTQSDV